MEQHEIDQAEWNNPANWYGRWLGIYHSKRDSRLWVPKRKPIMGWTVNTARPSGLALLIGVLLVTLVVIVAAIFAGE
jgi:uncharacterized membrane protein